MTRYTLVVVGFVFVFALTMAGDEGTKDEKLQDMQTRVDELAADMKTMHERLDSTITSSTERFDQLDLAQMGRTRAINAKVHATKSRRNFSLRTHPIHTMGP